MARLPPWKPSVHLASPAEGKAGSLALQRQGKRGLEGRLCRKKAARTTDLRREPSTAALRHSLLRRGQQAQLSFEARCGAALQKQGAVRWAEKRAAAVVFAKEKGPEEEARRRSAGESRNLAAGVYGEPQAADTALAEAGGERKSATKLRAKQWTVNVAGEAVDSATALGNWAEDATQTDRRNGVAQTPTKDFEEKNHLAVEEDIGLATLAAGAPTAARPNQSSRLAGATGLSVCTGVQIRSSAPAQTPMAEPKASEVSPHSPAAKEEAALPARSCSAEGVERAAKAECSRALVRGLVTRQKKRQGALCKGEAPRFVSNQRRRSPVAQKTAKRVRPLPHLQTE